jgi:hypothetical protein
MDKQSRNWLITGLILIVVLFIIIVVDAGKKRALRQAAAELEPVSVVDVVKSPLLAQEETGEAAAGSKPETAEKKEKADTEASAEAAEAGGVPAVFQMNEPAYEHTRPIVAFTHQKHIDEYNIGCGKCHHDENVEPLTDITMEDDVNRCIDCHDQPGRAPKDTPAGEEIYFHAEALHENCITCHRTYNKENDTKAAPASCSKCHKKS